jgi:hypothetical protein
MTTTTKTDGLALLRAPFPANQVSYLPKGGTKLAYVGHAALTDRLLDADPTWSWEPVPNAESLGLPCSPGGMWIRLTVCGVSRLGFGHAEGKKGGDAIKEIIGDALRNAAMRFGAALDLWHKGELHAEPEPTDAERAAARQQWLEKQFAAIDAAKSFGDLKIVLAAARDAARREDDDDAETQIMNYAEPKLEKAKAAMAAKAAKPDLKAAA